MIAERNLYQINTATTEIAHDVLLQKNMQLDKPCIKKTFFFFNDDGIYFPKKHIYQSCIYQKSVQLEKLSDWTEFKDFRQKMML